MVADEVKRRMFATYEAGEMLTMCAWCKRVEFESEWFLAPRVALAAIDSRFVLSHSICPPCADRGSPLPRMDALVV